MKSRLAASFSIAVIAVVAVTAGASILLSPPVPPENRPTLYPLEYAPWEHSSRSPGFCPEVGEIQNVGDYWQDGEKVRGFAIGMNPSFGEPCPNGWSEVFICEADCSYRCSKFIRLFP